MLVYHDLLGMLQHPHHAKVRTELTLCLILFICIWKQTPQALPLLQVTPKFCKQYGHVGDAINKALLEYREEVENKVFPSAPYSPYKMSAADVDVFLSELQKKGLGEAASSAAVAVEQFVGAGTRTKE